MRQFKKMTTRSRLSLFFLIIFFFSVSVTAAQNKVVVIPLFGNEPQATDPAPVEVTGQTTCYDDSGTVIGCSGTGQDGEHQKGIAWPTPRFTDNENGTVTDNLTGLIWLKNANCPNGEKLWSAALTFANSLHDGWAGDGSGGDCGLSDGSSAGAWRLPNVRELSSLIHYGLSYPAVPNTAGTGKWTEGDPFTGLQSSYYWSSTTGEGSTGYAWGVGMGSGYVSSYGKGGDYYVWPVRGGND